MPNKNVLAILSGVVALGLAALAVAMHGEALPVLGVDRRRGGPLLVGRDEPRPSQRPGPHGDRGRVGRALLPLRQLLGPRHLRARASPGRAVGLLPVMDGVWRLKLGFVVAVFLGALRRPLADGPQHERRQDPAAPLRGATGSPSPSRPGSISAAGCGSSTRSRSKRRSATSATTSPTRCARSSRPASASTRARAASRATSCRSSTRRSTSPSPETRAHPPQVQGHGGQVEDRRPLQQDVPGRARGDAGPGARTRSPSRSARTSRRRSASAPSRRPRTRSHRRIDELGLTRGQRHDARRGHHRRGPGRGRGDASTTSRRSSARPRASSSRWSTTAAARRSSAHRLKEDDTPGGRGHRAVHRGRAGRRRRQRHKKQPVKAYYARMSCQPAK